MRVRTRFGIPAAVAPLLLLGGACERPPPTGNEDPDSLVVYITLDAAVVAPGDTLVLEARGRRVRTDPDARFPDAQFTSLMPAVATVDQDGGVVAQAPGTAAIEARVDDNADTARVAVREAAAAPMARWRLVDVGFLTTCAIDEQDRLYCWGDGFYGTVGTGARRVFTRTLAPMPVEHPGRFAQVSVGEGHACAVTLDETLYCWGLNTSGQLGIGERTAPVPYPVTVPVTGVTNVATGLNFTCVLDRDGRRLCWGNDWSGQLGLGTSGEVRPAPVAAEDGVGLVDISGGAGTLHACGLDGTGAAYCWGDNQFGAVGIGSDEPVIATPTPVAGDLSFSKLKAAGNNSCGLDQDGLTYCWGFQGSTFLSRENAPLIVYAPELVESEVRFVELTVGWARCGLTDAGEAYCWGTNHEGQLGVGELGTGCNAEYVECSPVPVPVVGGHTWSMLSTGYETTCGITTDGALYCWGSNQSGQLGTGDPMDRSWTPVRVADPVIWP